MTRLLVIGVQVYGVDARRAAAASRFVRLRRIRELLDAGLLDDQLHRRTGDIFPAPPAH